MGKLSCSEYVMIQYYYFYPGVKWGKADVKNEVSFGCTFF